MTLVIERANYISNNGTEFTFLYSKKFREVRVYIGSRVHLNAKLHTTITNVPPEDSTKAMNNFVDAWNNADPRVTSISEKKIKHLLRP